MDRSEWIGRLELLHGRARSGGPLPEADRAWYVHARRALIATALSEQRNPLMDAERVRTSLRRERAVPVRIEAPGWSIHASTSDLGTGGLAVISERAAQLGERARATLELPRAHLATDAHVVGVAAAADMQRVSFAFDAPPPALVEAIEDHLLDHLLPELVFWDEVLSKIPW